MMPLAERKRAAAAIRQIADSIEQSSTIPTVAISTIHHSEPITRLETGPMIVDARYLGTTYIISTLPFDQAAGQKIRDVIERSCGIIR